MTVKELNHELSALPPDQEIGVYNTEYEEIEPISSVGIHPALTYDGLFLAIEFSMLEHS